MGCRNDIVDIGSILACGAIFAGFVSYILSDGLKIKDFQNPVPTLNQEAGIPSIPMPKKIHSNKKMVPVRLDFSYQYEG